MRYFYRDPLAAAWMAKHFGMRFTIKDGVCEPTWQELASSGNAIGYYVHPDSLPLLEPRPGDLVIVMGNVGFVPEGEGFAELYAQRLARSN